MVIGVVRDPSGIWDLISPRLTRCLPLTDLICSDPTGTYKHIEQVQIQFELEPHHPADAFFCILLFVSDHIDHYKRHKSLIDGFVHDPFVQIRSWLVAVVSLGTPGPVRPIRRLVERIEADLSDRIAANQGQVILIDLADGANNDRTQSDRLATALKWCVINTAEKRSAEFEYRLRSMQQLGTSLDFQSFCSIKESYSLFYQDLGLIDDALRQYHELDALLDTISISNSIAGAGTPAHDLDWPALLLSDDLVPLPSSSDPYHYVSFIFSRQIRLLFVRNRADDVLQRTARFVRNLNKFHDDLSDRTIQIVCIVISIAQMTNHIMIIELLSIALSSYTQSGINLHLLDFNVESVAFTSPSIKDHEHDYIDILDITPSQLQAAFRSPDLYQKHFIAFAELVRRASHDAGRHRFALSFSYRLASVYYRRGDIRRALEICDPGTSTTRNLWSYCWFSDLILTSQCHYALNHIQEYIDTGIMIFKIQSTQDQVRRRFRDQFMERMKDESVGMFRRSGSELVDIQSLELKRDHAELHTACNTDVFSNELFQFELVLKSVCCLDLDITNIIIILDCMAVKERLELGPVTLYSGTNRFVFDNAKLAIPGEHWPISVQIHIHELVLESVLNQSGQHLIRVRHRSPTATLRLGPVPEPLILGRTHAVPVQCQSNYDTMTNVQLSLQSISDSNLVQTDHITVTVNNVSMDVTLHNGQFPIPECVSGSVLDIILYINAPIDGVLRQDLSLTLTYTVDNVNVSTQAHTSLIFTPALSLTSCMETVLSRTFIQLIISCVTHIPVLLHSYTFQPGPFSYEDLNPHLTTNLIPSSNTGYSFIFEIFDRTGPDRDIDDPDFLENFVFRGHFNVRYQPADGILSDFSFPINIQSLKHNPLFHIITSCKSNGILGQPIQYSIRLNRASQSTVSTPRVIIQQIVYSIVMDESSWRYAGKLHGRVSFQNEAVISGVLIPIMCGYLPVPSIKLAEIIDGNLMDIDPEQISIEFDTRQVLVLSQGRCTVGLNITQLS